MIKKIFIILILGLIAAGSLFAFQVSVRAQNSNPYTLLAPLPGLPNTLPSDNPLGTYVPIIFNLLIGLSAVAAVLNIIFGGLQYISTDAIQGKSSGKERIKNAFFALACVLGAWLILNTINPNLLKIDLKLYIPPTTATNGIGGIFFTYTNDGSGTGGIATGADLLSGASMADDNANRAALQAKYVTTNSGPCTDATPSHCTDLNGLPATMMSSLELLQANCTKTNGGNMCGIMITGGTESSLHPVTNGNPNPHGPGQSTVDLKPTGTLNTYLRDPTPQNGDKKVVSGLSYTYESTGANGTAAGNHWHVTAVTTPTTP